MNNKLSFNAIALSLAAFSATSITSAAALTSAIQGDDEVQLAGKKVAKTGKSGKKEGKKDRQNRKKDAGGTGGCGAGSCG